MILSTFSWAVILIVGVIYTVWYVINHKEQSIFIKLALVTMIILNIGALDRLTYKYFKLLNPYTYTCIVGVLFDLLYTFIYIGSYVSNIKAGKKYSKRKLILFIGEYLFAIGVFTWLFFINGILYETK